MNVTVLASGRGSNLRALAQAVDAGTCCAVLRALVTDRADAAARTFAEDRGMETFVLPLRQGDDREAWNRALGDLLEQTHPDLVVLAGFMRILGAKVVHRFRGRIINVHPALLPAFPGHDAPAQAIRGGVRVSGCTVHVVNEGVDTGPILAQTAVPVFPGDDATSLHTRIQREEHTLLPRVVDWIGHGHLTLLPRPRFVAPVAYIDARLVVPVLEAERP